MLKQLLFKKYFLKLDIFLVWTKVIVKYFIVSMEQLTCMVHAAVKHVNMDGKEPSATNEVLIYFEL